MTLPPLTLDDIRVAGPDRDNAEAFEPAETWVAACGRIGEGHAADTVAALLMEMHDNERGALADYWRDHTLTTLENPATMGRDFGCPDLRLALAMQAAEPDCEAWSCAPTLDPESLWETVIAFDAIKAENAALLAVLVDILDYSGGADNALDDPYVMERAQAVRAKAEGTR